MENPTFILEMGGRHPSQCVDREKVSNDILTHRVTEVTGNFIDSPPSASYDRKDMRISLVVQIVELNALSGLVSQ
jgi:hypothetical protein